jgi:hypothetical protein
MQNDKTRIEINNELKCTVLTLFILVFVIDP